MSCRDSIVKLDPNWTCACDLERNLVSSVSVSKEREYERPAIAFREQSCLLVTAQKVVEQASCPAMTLSITVVPGSILCKLILPDCRKHEQRQSVVA